MSTPSISELHAKVRLLETGNGRLNRRQRVATLALGSLLLMSMVAAPSKVITAERVEAKEFLIRDKTGVRLNLKLAKDGSVGIFLRDTEGKERLAFHAQDDGLAGFVLQDPAGRERLSALTQKDGLAGLFVSDHEGKERLSLMTQPDGMAALYARDQKGNERVSTVTQKDGLGGVFVTDADGETVHSFAK